jgi:hypothetical protein
MLPSIALVLGVEMIRDGGSLAAVFQGANGAEYSLYFPLRHRTLPSGVFERLGYAKPLVIERQAAIEVEVSWPHATALINQIRPLVLEPRHLGWLDAMASTAAAEGVLPHNVERFLPSLGPEAGRETA